MENIKMIEIIAVAVVAAVILTLIFTGYIQIELGQPKIKSEQQAGDVVTNISSSVENIESILESIDESIK